MRAAGLVASLVLASIAVLHAVWVVSPWPLANRADFARLVVGVPEEKLPSGPLTAAVALLLGAAAYIVAARAGLVPEIGPHWAYVAGGFAVAGVLLLRGAAGLLMSGVRGGGAADFNFWDLRIYSPLCLVLAGLSLWVADSG